MGGIRLPSGYPAFLNPLPVVLSEALSCEKSVDVELIGSEAAKKIEIIRKRFIKAIANRNLQRLKPLHYIGETVINQHSEPAREPDAVGSALGVHTYLMLLFGAHGKDIENDRLFVKRSLG